MILDGDNVVYEVVHDGVVLGVENVNTEDLDEEEANNLEGLLKVLSWYEMLVLIETSVENSLLIGDIVVEDSEVADVEDLEAGDMDALIRPGLFLILLMEAL